MRFSVPSSCACKSRKFSVAFKSGYRSTTTSKRDKADESWPWAWFKRRQLGGIGRRGVGVNLHLPHRGPRRGDFRQRGFLEIGRAGNGGDEIGDEVGPALIDVLHLRPLAVHALRQFDEMVVTAARRQAIRIKTRRPSTTRTPRTMTSFFIMTVTL